jgi:hypothetical protein
MARIALLLLALLAGPGRAAGADLVGYAYDRASGEPLYSEHHFQRFDGASLVDHRVEYRDPGGSLIAEKTLAYRRRPFAPEFRLKDARDGYAEGGRWRGGAYEMYRVLDGDEDRKDVAARPDLVADAGFDRFVRAHLASLRRGEPREVRLAVPGRMASLSLVIEPDPGARPAEGEIELRVRPASLLRYFVGPIRLTYDSRSGRLLRYTGISNIRSASGEHHDARIEFPVDGQRPRGFDGG